MFDAQLKRRLDPHLARFGAELARHGIGANTVTLAGFGLGLVAALMLSLGWFLCALVVLLLSRLADGLDGAVARSGTPTDLGGYLDIVLDFAFYGLIPFGFALFDPTNNALSAAFLL